MNKGMRKIAALALMALLAISQPIAAFAADSTAASTDAVKQTLYKEMTNRSAAFAINYIGDDHKLITNDLLAFFKPVYSGSDDYLKWNMDSFSVKYQAAGNVVLLSFNIKYLTTKEQEAYVDRTTDEALDALLMPGMSDHDKLCAIHAYICDRVSYDYSLKNYSAYKALADRKAVCQGYSLLMDKMLEKAGVATKIIDGTMDSGPHAWNMVRLDDIWYHVDATNNDINKNRYFLKTDDYMRDQGYKWNAAAFPKALTEFTPPIRITVRVDGQTVAFDVPPYVNADNRTMVPIRFVSESLGASVQWDDAARAVRISCGSDAIIMPVGTSTILMNGVACEMDTEAVLKNGRTMVPIRFISEYLGADVSWDPTNRIVDIYSDRYGRL